MATALIAAPLLLFIALLGSSISLRRMREKVGPGMSGSTGFVRLQRAHGNAVEHVPLVLLGLLLLELSGGSRNLVLAIGGIFLLARASHAVGLVRIRPPLHVAGAAVTYGMEFLLAILLLCAQLR